nr:cupin [Actinomycetales bacterium]
MNVIEIVREQFALAHAHERGRSAGLIAHDGVLRQTVVALLEGGVLSEHNAPHAASLFCLKGRIRITGSDPVEIAEGELAVLTHEPHGVEALADSAFLLTTVTSVPENVKEES